MKVFTKPCRLGIFQLLVACLLVALLTSPGEAKGYKLLIKGGHGHGGGHGGGGAAAILAAGLVIKLLGHLKKAHGAHGGFSGGHGYSGSGYSGGEGHGYSGGEGHGYGMARMAMVPSFESHDEHLMDYGYEPQGYAWAK